MCLVVGIGIHLVPKCISLNGLDVACGKGIVEGGSEDDDYEVFAWVIMFEVETLEIAVSPFDVVSLGLGTFLKVPELMLVT